MTNLTMRDLDAAGSFDASTTGGSTPERSTGEKAVAAVIFGAVTVAIAAIGSLINSAGMDWYDSLEQPSIAPPGPTFGIVWTILYAMIAVSGWLAWRATSRPAPTLTWAVQMGLNFAWTAVFFGLESIGGGLIVIGLLLAAIVVSALVAWRVSHAAALLLVPYIAWVGFATALNAAYAFENFS
jgi:tryptophan-rich sensory protein